MKNITSQITHIIAELLGLEVSQVVPEARMIDDLGADEQDMIELIDALEQVFDITITDEEADRLSSVQEVIDFVPTKIAS